MSNRRLHLFVISKLSESNQHFVDTRTGTSGICFIEFSKCYIMPVCRSNRVLKFFVPSAVQVFNNCSCPWVYCIVGLP